MKPKRSVILLSSAIFAISLFIFAWAQSAEKPKNNLLRVGMYDSRAITIAYSDSAYNDNLMLKKSKEKKEAEQAGDMEKAKKIDAWMTWFSIHRHAQGFSTTPVHDLLECVEKEIPQVARQAGVDVIVSKWEFDYMTSDAEVVDVTEQLAELFEPKSDVSQIIKKFKDMKPVPYEEIVRHELEGGH